MKNSYPATSFGYTVLLPTGSEERGVLEVGSIPVALLPSCMYMNKNCIRLHKYDYRWVVKIKKHKGGSTQVQIHALATVLQALVSVIALGSIVAIIILETFFCIRTSTS